MVQNKANYISNMEDDSKKKKHKSEWLNAFTAGFFFVSVKQKAKKKIHTVIIFVILDGGDDKF